MHMSLQGKFFSFLAHIQDAFLHELLTLKTDEAAEGKNTILTERNSVLIGNWTPFPKIMLMMWLDEEKTNFHKKNLVNKYQNTV